MIPEMIAVALDRFAELVETKMATGKAAKQVSDELRAFDVYCVKNRIKPSVVKTDHLRLCKYK